mmetsp:Transcript_25889/g.54714  ORF Transcript_25889/g.54714 Transcript_25889/m.54714 type:complete len:116 (-) Transcript_25889:313-660(-)
MKSSLLSSILLVSLAAHCAAFVQPNTARNTHLDVSGVQETPVAYLPKASIYSSPALRMAKRDDDKNVNVNLIPDVDAFSLTAVGFGLIAFNFFVLANMGDAGLGGLVARIINTFG